MTCPLVSAQVPGMLPLLAGKPTVPPHQEGLKDAVVPNVERPGRSPATPLPVES